MTKKTIKSSGSSAKSDGLEVILERMRKGESPGRMMVKYKGQDVGGLTHRGRSGTRRLFSGGNPVNVDILEDQVHYVRSAINNPETWEISDIEW